MAGTCDVCGTVSRDVRSCNACGATVCPDHSREYGCDVCKGGQVTV
ncbi:MAG: hypothetical protein ABEI97_00800 [Candidatus Nanohaloarchaea archaeon]